MLALIAHDARKDDLVAFATRRRADLAHFDLLATGTTGGRLADATGLAVERVRSGPVGGDVQIGARLLDGGVVAVLFLRDPMTAHPHEPDIQALLKLCDIHDVPLATNLPTAELVLDGLLRAVTPAGTDPAGADPAGADPASAEPAGADG
ncbi:MAG: methylglyoxal synthase [Nitriliruptoraceae bacterium]|nr:methylglyoxal synthase [Nitriliruptoraceae bacterium]